MTEAARVPCDVRGFDPTKDASSANAAGQFLEPLKAPVHVRVPSHGTGRAAGDISHSWMGWEDGQKKAVWWSSAAYPTQGGVTQQPVAHEDDLRSFCRFLVDRHGMSYQGCKFIVPKNDPLVSETCWGVLRNRD